MWPTVHLFEETIMCLLGCFYEKGDWTQINMSEHPTEHTPNEIGYRTNIITFCSHHLYFIDEYKPTIHIHPMHIYVKK